MTPLSAVLITRDEERNLAAALDSLAFCDEILVMDSGSTDETRQIAEQRGARVIVSTPWPGFVEQRNRAVDAAQHDWILAVDADEQISGALREEIQALRAAGLDGAGYRMPRVAHYLGRWIRGTDWYPDFQLRLFDRRRARWQGQLVHESVAARGPVARLAGEIEHYPYADISAHMRTIDHYTNLWARQSFDSGRRAGPLDLSLTPLWSFLRSYILRGGVGLGRAGFVVSVLGAYYTFAKFAKLAEIAQIERARR